jgi:hypothetical protein
VLLQICHRPVSPNPSRFQERFAPAPAYGAAPQTIPAIQPTLPAVPNLGALVLDHRPERRGLQDVSCYTATLQLLTRRMAREGRSRPRG